MRTIFRFVATCATPVLAPLGMATLPVAAAEFDVPGDFPTIQLAVAAVEAEAEDADAEHYINLTAPIVPTTAEVVLDEDLGPTRRLTIRPGPDLDRATVLSLNGTQPIFRFSDADNVTIQDLDIVRNTTNAADLIVMTYGGFAGNIDNTLERCRVGSTWTVPGAANCVYVRIIKPTRTMIRNCMFFALAPGTFDVGISASGFADPDNSVFLYNNVVADHKVIGINIVDGFGGTTLVLRNNVVLNHPDAPVEPWAYRSNVAAAVNVAQSHNVAFASAGAVEQVFGAKPIAVGVPSFLRFDRDDGIDAFDQVRWVFDPEFDDPEDNENLFCLTMDGMLHDDALDVGQTVLADGAPTPADRAVIDDWEKDLRPSGDPLHTDRGADQAEGALALAAPDVASASSWVVAERNPSRSVAVLYRAPAAGILSFDVIDVAGRRLHRSEKSVVEGDTGRFAWERRPAPGVYWVRVRLAPSSGTAAQLTERIVVRR